MHRLKKGRAAGDLAGMAAGPGEQHRQASPTQAALNRPAGRAAGPAAPAAGVFFGLRHLAGRAGGRRAGARRVFEAEGLGEADRRGPGPAWPRNRPPVSPGWPTMKSDDSAMSGRAARSRSTMPQVVGRGMPAVHRRQDAVGAGLHRQVQERHQRRHIAMRGDQLVVHVARVGRGVAQPQQARGSRPARAAAGRGPRCRRPAPRRARH